MKLQSRILLRVSLELRVSWKIIIDRKKMSFEKITKGSKRASKKVSMKPVYSRSRI